jgi:polyketide synthase 7
MGEALGDARPPLLSSLIPLSPERRPGGSPLVERLRTAPANEREGLILSLVQAEVQAVLGLASPPDAKAGFFDLGMDSLMAVEIRNKLAAATALKLPATLLFDYPAPDDLARFIQGQLKAPATMYPSSVGSDATDGTLAKLLKHSFETGETEDVDRILESAVKIRLKAESKLIGFKAFQEASPIILARGQEKPQLICFSSFFLPAGPTVYARFTANMRARRTIWVLPHSGFNDQEALRQDFDEFIATRAKHALSCANGAPFVLVGHSAGGWIAVKVAEHLASIGQSAAGVVLLDTLEIDQISPAMIKMIRKNTVERASCLGGISDSAMTAMTWYTEFLLPERFQLPFSFPSSPTLLVRATEPAPEFAGYEWRTRWGRATDVVDVTGDHNSILEKKETADIVDNWATLIASREHRHSDSNSG